jgi:hypothetical protein
MVYDLLLEFVEEELLLVALDQLTNLIESE